jgi:hypothetical protein
MKCEHCGQEIKSLTNFDRLKACRNIEDLDDLVEKICSEKTCPLKKWHVGDDCLLNELAIWLFEEAKG